MQSRLCLKKSSEKIQQKLYILIIIMVMLHSLNNHNHNMIPLSRKAPYLDQFRPITTWSWELNYVPETRTRSWDLRNQAHSSIWNSMHSSDRNCMATNIKPSIKLSHEQQHNSRLTGAKSWKAPWAWSLGRAFCQLTPLPYRVSAVGVGCVLTFYETSNILGLFSNTLKYGGTNFQKTKGWFICIYYNHHLVLAKTEVNFEKPKLSASSL